MQLSAYLDWSTKGRTTLAVGGEIPGGRGSATVVLGLKNKTKF